MADEIASSDATNALQRSADGDPRAEIDSSHDGERSSARRMHTMEDLALVGASVIAPDVLELLDLDQQQIDALLQAVPGGLATVQEIYPLSPLQEGILFHYLLNDKVDAYVLSILFELESRARLDDLINAVQRVIDRHDVLRTAVVWEEMARPLQVAYRSAALPIEELSLSPEVDAIEQLKEWTKPTSRKRDLRKAPLVWLQVAADLGSSRWYAVLKVHHLICDHQSLRVIVAEVLAGLRGQDDVLPSPIPFRSQVLQAIHGTRTDAAAAFFRRKLGDIDEPTAPFGVFDVHGDGSQIEEAQEFLEPALADEVRKQARRFGVSAARFFHAAWALVVARTSGRDDVVFGTVLLAAGQRSASAQRMLGLSVNTLPLRLRLRDVTAEELLRQTHRELVELLHHETASLSWVQGCSGVSGATPLFTALLNYRHSESESDADGAAGVRVLARGEAWTNYPLTMTVDDLGAGFLLMAKADRRIGSVRVLEYLGTALQSLSSALGQAPHTRALALSILPEQERRQVIESFNSTRQPQPEDGLIHVLFEKQVQLSPTASAVLFEGRSLTYAALNEKANQLARYLQNRGVGPNQLVALCLERSVEMLIGILAILKAGGAYVPLDPSNPADRLAYVLKDAAPRVLLTKGGLKAGLPKSQSQMILLDDDWSEIAQLEQGNLDSEVMRLNPYHLAYVIYTSGTTGNPKGVMVEHRNVVNYAAHAIRNFDVISGDGSLVCTSLSFDLMLTGLYPPLLCGRTIRLCPEQLGLPALAEELPKCRQLAPLKLTPSHLALLDQPLRSGRLAGCVRTLVLGGEPLPAKTVQLWRTHAPSTRIFNHYGPTETTVGVIVHEVGASDADPLPLGRPISNAQIYILNRQGQPVPIGVVGEIYIGGAGVARGYLNRPALTAERFLNDPFSAAPGARMYKTGDLGRWNVGGTVEFLGRNDHQVKIRGFRIELGEIESQLVRHEYVKEAVIMVRKDALDEQRLVAYVVPVAASAPSPDMLRSHLKSVLPEYMVPSAFVLLQRMPLTPNGKVDRRALPEPEGEAYVSRRYEPPQGDVEEVVAGIWQALLRVERVGRLDNFFELGGHSLLLVQMLDRLRRMGLAADVRSIFESPSLADLASTLMRGAESQFVVPPNRIPSGCQAITPGMLPLIDLELDHIEEITRAVPGGVANIQDVYPLAPLQEGILFHHLLNEGGSDAYVRLTAFSLSSAEQLEALIRALQAVIDRHDVLRTAVLWKHLPQAVQVVYREAKLSVEAMAFVGEPIEQIQEWLKPEGQKLDLTQAPLIRMQVAASTRDGRRYVVLKSHHIVSDYASQEVLTSEVVAQLQGLAQELPASIPYRNHVALALSSSQTHDAQAYFRSKLADIDEPTAPFGLIDVHGSGSNVQAIRESCEPALSQRVRTQARSLAVSAATLFHAAWALVVARTSGRTDVVFGTVLSGRLQGDVGTSAAVGMFINTLPLRLRLFGLNVRAFVEQTQRELVELLRHEQASLAAAQRCSGIAASAPLFTTLFNYRHSLPNPEGPWSSVGIQVLAAEQRTNYPITCSVDDLGDGFVLNAQTDRRIDPSRLTGYLRSALVSLVDALEQGPQTQVTELEILPESERRKVTESFNTTQQAYPHEKLIHELFEEQAARTPDAVAVVYGMESLSYAAINEKANQLARFLRGQGVQDGEYLPVHMTRSLDMVIAQLAVLKSAAVYVPIDPELPAERRIFMIRDCSASRVLADAEVPHKLTNERVTWIDCTRIAAVSSTLSGRNLKASINSRLPAYVMYTSGSTGMPKGVVVPQQAVNRLVINNSYAPIGPEDCLVHYSNPAFDASTFEIWGALLNGARLVVVPPDIVLDAHRFAEMLRQQRVTLLWMSVGLFNQYTEALAQVFQQLRYLIVGGDTLDVAAVSRVLKNSPPRYLLNAYGPTEGTTFSTTHLISPVHEAMTSIPIGRPISNAQVYILDTCLQVVPVGVAGELYIGGDGIARGYLNRPQLTSARFLADPFSAEPHARMYKTGDVGRWRADGAIEFLGRNDFQVKIRGFRIELGEIEAQLVRHQKVQEAVVIQRERRLVAYMAPRDPADVDALPGADELRAYLKEVVPDYMIPSAFVALARMPLTPNGKLDRRALPVPEMGAYASLDYEPPEGTVEQILAQVWQELLHVDRVGRLDNFFELGGHSLLVLQALFRIKKAFGCDLNVRDLYRNSTLKDLSARIGGRIIEEDVVDLAKEATLDADIVARPGTRRFPEDVVLLTGACGFVGRFLLAQLLSDSRAIIYCLVKAQSALEAASRLRITMTKWDLWRKEFEERVVAIPGDLRLPRLGMDEATYRLLSGHVDTIYHCATSMNHLETYAMAKAANVNSARELVQLAIEHKPKLINYLSTLSIFGASDSALPRLVDELSSIDRERHSASRGYAASKWVGEKIFMIAGERGVACNIFRLGLVWCDTQQGRYSELQREYRVLKSSLLSGYGISHYRYPIAPSPVDYVARSVVFLANAHRDGQGIFHITSAQEAVEDLFERFNAVAGTSLQLVSLYEWIGEIKRLHGAGWSLPVVPLVEFAFNMDEESFQEHERRVQWQNIHIDSQKTHRELERAGILSPRLSDDLLRLFVESMLSRDVELHEMVASKRDSIALRRMSVPQRGSF